MKNINLKMKKCLTRVVSEKSLKALGRGFEYRWKDNMKVKADNVKTISV